MFTMQSAVFGMCAYTRICCDLEVSNFYVTKWMFWLVMFVLVLDLGVFVPPWPPSLFATLLAGLPGFACDGVVCHLMWLNVI